MGYVSSLEGNLFNLQDSGIPVIILGGMSYHPQGVEGVDPGRWFAENRMNWNTWAENTSPPKPY